MRSLILLPLIFGGCSAKAHIPLQNLDRYPTSGNITLFDHERFTSSVPEHNIIPPHGKIEKDKIIHHLRQCSGNGKYSICGETNFLGTDLTINLYENEKSVLSTTLKGKFGDGLFRFFGAPSARIFKTIYFTDLKVGIINSFGFTLISNKKFCDTVSLPGNDEFSFGLTSDDEVVLIGNGPQLPDQKRVDGWRLYDEKKLCH